MDENKKNSVKNSILNTTATLRTVCEIHREMWDIIDKEML